MSACCAGSELERAEDDEWSDVVEHDDGLLADDPDVLLRIEAKRAKRLADEEKRKTALRREAELKKALSEALMGQLSVTLKRESPVLKAVREAFANPPPMPTRLVQRYEVPDVLCQFCADSRISRQLRDALLTLGEICFFKNSCNFNKVILAWAEQSSAQDPPVNETEAVWEQIQRTALAKPTVNAAAMLADRKQYAHLARLLTVAPQLRNHHLLFVIASRADVDGLDVLRKSWQVHPGKQASFEEWVWTMHDVLIGGAYEPNPTERAPASILHLCITAGELGFALEHLWIPLRVAIERNRL